MKLSDVKIAIDDETYVPLIECKLSLSMEDMEHFQNLESAFPADAYQLLGQGIYEQLERLIKEERAK